MGHPVFPMAMAACAVLAIACSLGPSHTAYALTKPLPLLVALAWVLAWMRTTPDPVRAASAAPRALLLALGLSLLGDICLLWPAGFLPGLGAFWLAHAVYVGVLRRGVGWMPRPGALLACVGAGGVMLAYLWLHGLPAAMRGPVAAYVLVIALMAAQALGRASVLGTRAARCVAAGALCFMASDAVLAYDRFVQPLPAATLWVLASYYTAQGLIVGGLLRGWAQGVLRGGE